MTAARDSFAVPSFPAPPDVASIVSNLPGMVCRWRNDRRRSAAFVSAGALEVCGHDAEAFLAGNVHWGHLVHPDDRERIESALRAAALAGRPYELEYRIVHRDGSERRVCERGSAVCGADGCIDWLDGYVADITADRQATAAAEQLARQHSVDLAKAERQRLFDVLEALPVYVCLLTPDYHTPFANRKFRECFGYHPKRKCYEFLFDRNSPCENCETYNVLKTDQPQRWEWTGPNGRHYDIFDFPFTDTDGSQLILEMGIDITERKQAERALRELNESLEGRIAQRTAELRQSREDLDRAQAAGHIGWWRLKTHGNELIWSAENHRMMGVPEGTPMTYEAFLDVVHPDDREYVHVKWQAALRGEAYDIEHRVVVGGEVKWVRESGYLDLDGDGRVQGGFGITRDVTENKVAAAALREEEERYRTLFESMTEGFSLHEIITDEQGRPVDYLFLDVNPAFERLTGLKCRDVIGKRVLEVLPSIEPEWIEDYGRVALTGEPVNFERPAAGLGRWYEVFAYRPAPRQFAVMFTDITERKAMSDALAEAKEAADQASRAKSIFLANMSHEMRTPLNAIVGLCHLLRRDAAGHPLNARIDQMIAASDHLVGLISDVLELSRIEAGRLVLDAADFSLGDVVTRTLEVLAWPARAKGLALATDIPPALLGATFRGDALRLTQVLINLGGNAVKFTEEGSVRLAIEACGDTDGGMRLRFAVSDTGIGIRADDQALVFEPFTRVDCEATRSKDGSGLGLMISQRLVNAMGGCIEVVSAPDAGSTFSFEIDLPRSNAEFVAITDAEGMSFPGRRVLLAEDDLLSQEIVFQMLEDLGCEVEIASDGAEALACARDKDYDLILMDMRMPRMDGLAAARAIRASARHRHTPIIAISANAFAEDRQRCLEAGMNSHLAKPVTPTRLATALAQWLPDLVVRGDRADCEDAVGRALRAVPCLDSSSWHWQTPADVAAYSDLLQRFMAETTCEIATLHERLEAGDAATAHDFAHRLKGLAGLVGAHRVAATAERITAALRGDTPLANVAAEVDACAEALAELGAAIAALPTAS